MPKKTFNQSLHQLTNSTAFKHFINADYKPPKPRFTLVEENIFTQHNEQHPETITPRCFKTVLSYYLIGGPLVVIALAAITSLENHLLIQANANENQRTIVMVVTLLIVINILKKKYKASPLANGVSLFNINQQTPAIDRLQKNNALYDAALQFLNKNGAEAKTDDSYLCQISYQVMMQPVIIVHPNNGEPTYVDLSSLQQWLNKKGRNAKNPFTNERFSNNFKEALTNNPTSLIDHDKQNSIKECITAAINRYNSKALSDPSPSTHTHIL